MQFRSLITVTTEISFWRGIMPIHSFCPSACLTAFFAITYWMTQKLFAANAKSGIVTSVFNVDNLHSPDLPSSYILYYSGSNSFLTTAPKTSRKSFFLSAISTCLSLNLCSITEIKNSAASASIFPLSPVMQIFTSGTCP